MFRCRFWICIALCTAALYGGTFTVIPTNNPSTLAGAILGSGINISNLSFTGDPSAAGTFVNFSTDIWTNPITKLSGRSNLANGIILTSGIADCGAAAFDGSGCSNDTNGPGDNDLNTLSGFPTYDATILEFDFEANDGSPTAHFNFVFTSTEYPVYVNSPFNDVFAFFVNGVNVARLPGVLPETPTAINTVNVGNPTGAYVPDPTHPEFFTQYSVTGVTPFNWGGATRVFKLAFPIHSGTNHIKLAIADASDHILDSAVLIQGDTFSTREIEADDRVFVPEPASSMQIAGGLGILLWFWMRGRKVKAR